MPKVAYYSPSMRESFSLDDELTIETARELRGRKYTYKLGCRGIYNVANDARSVGVHLLSTNDGLLDKFRHALDGDLRNNTPGILSVGEFSTELFCVGTKADTITPLLKELTLDIVLISGGWVRSHSLQLIPRHEEPTGIDYPHDFPFDYSGSGAATHIDVNSPIDADFKMVIYGAVTNPQITIGGNIYRVNKDIAANARVEINSRDKTIVFIDGEGNRADIFDLGVRSTGKGSGNYIFEPLKPGENKIEWTGAFGVDITYFEKDTVVPWSL